jgi:DNA topoisomerase II
MDTKEKLAEKYQQKTAKEHILDAPDTYIGLVEEDVTKGYTASNDNGLEYKEFKWVPGLFKLFDEGIVNCRDHVIRLHEMVKEKVKKIIPVKTIEITVNKETGVITMMNDGNGIDVEKHPEHKIWIPEMIFGHLRTSTNYKKSQKKIVGGKNGFGFKLVLIYSEWGEIETIDHIRKKKYTQKFLHNLDTIVEPVIKKSTLKPYTLVKFKPDYKRFGLEGMTDDMFNLFKKRTIDIAAVTGHDVKVKFNGELIDIKGFENYIDSFIGTKLESKRLFETTHPRWEYCVCISPFDEFRQVSYVNGISTSKGGKHVDYILNQIVKKMIMYIEKKKKIKVRPASIKEQLMLFVNCVIENPSFDSQTKDYMNLPVAKFGSRCEVSNVFIEKLAKMGIMEAALNSNQLKEIHGAKKTDGKKTKSIRGVPKLIDANWAGGSKASQCVLILCEGDSAKAGIVSGLSREDRNIYGVFPLKGKLLNAKDASIKKISDNNEITAIKKIMGLEINKKYTKEDIEKKFRYGSIMIMTDQDLDGSHIKGLCINLFQSQWNDLIKIDSFLGFMNTPILKAKKGGREKQFYNECEYEKWKESNNDGKGWKIKYYKGLGTSTAKEFKEYFANKKIIKFKFGEQCNDRIDMVFNKKRADDRKGWLIKYDKKSILNTDKKEISYEDFIDKEMIHFSKYDNERSIPNMMDGLKTSLRKILFSAFKRNLITEIKVAQFAGYISEHSCYHHGEMSLNGGIVGMAQEFVGSNNINHLLPKGQFGTRLMGGKDSASERYIFTNLNKLTRTIFNPDDIPILNYLNDDGTQVEPEYYLPVIPMIIVNGGKGIGTGFSYEGLSYNPKDIVEYLKCHLRGKSTGHIVFKPYYEGFKGTIEKIVDKRYLIKGKYKMINYQNIQITELPIGTWTVDYKKHLELLMDDKKKNSRPLIKEIIDLSTDALVDIKIKFYGSELQKLITKSSDYGCNMLEKKLKLFTTKSETNMWLFDKNQRLKKYNTVKEIIDEYIIERFDGYKRRKIYMIKELQRTVTLLSNKARFIEEQCQDVIDLRKKKKDVVIELLKTRNYDVIDEDIEYKYLRQMKLEMVEEENLAKLRKEKEGKMNELEILKNISESKMWFNDIKKFEKDYDRYLIEREDRLFGKKTKKKKIKLKKNTKL